MYLGVPDSASTLDLFGVASVEEVDRSSAHGFLMFSPIVPFDDNAVTTAMGLLEDVRNTHAVETQLCVNVLDARALDFSIFLHFDHQNADEGGPTTAHAALNALYEMFEGNGFHPYRRDIAHQDGPNTCRDPEYRALLASLSRALDPHEVIAPNRYVPRASGATVHQLSE